MIRESWRIHLEWNDRGIIVVIVSRALFNVYVNCCRVVAAVVVLLGRSVAVSVVLLCCQDVLL